MAAVNAGMNRLFGLLWAPFAGLDPWVGLAVISILLGIVALIAMKYCSNQRRIAALKDRYKGHVLAIKLFRDDLGVVLSSLGKTLGLISFYLGHQLRPMAVMIVPFVLLFAQLQMRLAYRPVDLGAKTLITVEVAGAPTDVRMRLPQGVEPAGHPVRIASLGQAVFPVRATAAGLHELRFEMAGEVAVKSLHAGPARGRRLTMLSPLRSSGFWDQLLMPTEAPFPAASAFKSIALTYPILELPLLGVDFSFGSELGMGITFMVLSIVAAMLLKGVFGVTI